MLSHLSVKNLALIDHVELSFAPGLTVLTGETGAGKSILVEALLLLLGQRASADVIRQGEREGSVEAIWHLGPDGAGARVRAALDEAGLPPLEDEQLILRRIVSREGRHKQQVNGALCTVAQLRSVTEHLVDFTGQHAHQQLVRADAALNLVDGYGAKDAAYERDVAAMAEAFGAAQAIDRELRELREKEAEKERRLDVIGFYLDEINALSPVAGEDDALEIERRRLQNAGRLKDAVDETRQLLVDGDDDALTKVQQAQASLRRAAKDDESLRDLVDSLDSAAAILDDVAREIARRGDVEEDPARIDAVEERLDALRKVMKKHGGSVASVLEAQAELQAEHDLLQAATERIAALEKERDVAVATAAVIADRLSAAREGSATSLARAIEAELPPLGMASARVQFSVGPLAAGSGAITDAQGRALSSTGRDLVELRFSANAGEAPAALSKVASGGELSRVLLAIKRVLLDADPVPVSVFDEVDAGVGGAIGEAIGEKLEAIAGKNRQVLCITHLPQIACRGEGHLVVEKGVVEGRTVSRVRVLDDVAREGEVARMLGGREITATTLTHAKEMLAQAKSSRSAAQAPSAPEPKATKGKGKRPVAMPPA